LFGVFMKSAFSPTLLAIFFGWLMAAKAQTFEVRRPDAAYHPDNVLDPATLLSPRNFANTESGRYVVVEGYMMAPVEMIK
jgi:hypothetical protein